MHVRYLIVGAGPTGLGAAHCLEGLGEKSFLVVEKEDYAGGLAASFTDSSGFTWDIGGHVVFSHYGYFDRLLEELLGDAYLEHQRKSLIRLAGTWTPYPFQNNIRHLPKELVWECLEGLFDAKEAPPSRPSNFREWILSTFGQGIARLFLFPYNAKVWAIDPEQMNSTWVGERVSVVDVRRVLRNIVLEQDDVGWGPNNLFRFPLFGGTGEIFRRLAARFGERVRLGCPVISIDADKKEALLNDGQRITYDAMLFTGSIDLLVRTLLTSPHDAAFTAAGKLKHNGSLIAGVAVDGMNEDDTCWMYFPESNCPFYRVTNFHNYSPNNTPDPVGMRAIKRALMTEVSFSRWKPENEADHIDRVIDGLVNASLLKQDEKKHVLSVFEYKAERAYPIPCLDRDAALAVIQPWLQSLDIYSRGRFGGFKYEVGNMDHSVMQGVQWANLVTTKTPETIYSYTQP
ncbi:protoporphyrinogen/coproporphyrinogen oxidase [Desulfovibrio inopinatus]|uniref:protoporphyrinogen/coproporphyrinogen oxidase n=1 Tax=Desulfovibrio inopinatus TaxID=102109 RepID=UPI0004201E31|nr:FAD-dependent oxidoreductase [Desulfovibrio inopinatus]